MQCGCKPLKFYQQAAPVHCTHSLQALLRVDHRAYGIHALVFRRMVIRKSSGYGTCPRRKRRSYIYKACRVRTERHVDVQFARRRLLCSRSRADLCIIEKISDLCARSLNTENIAGVVAIGDLRPAGSVLIYQQRFIISQIESIVYGGIIRIGITG